MTGSVKNHLKQALPSAVIMFLMIIAAAMASSSFLSVANIRNIFTQTAVLACVSVAQSLVLFIGGIDMSVSSVISISTIFLAMYSGESTLGLIGSILLALAAGALTGLVNGVGTVVFKIPAMIITISTQAFLKGICLILMPKSGGKVNPAFMKLMKNKIGVCTVMFLVALLVYAVVFLVMHYTDCGRKVYAIGNSELYAEQSGINTKKVIICVYIAAGMIAALSGILLGSRISSGNALVGDSYAMDSVAAAVVGGISMNGGIGTVIGALFGAIILSLINNIMNNIGISPYYQYIIKGLLLMVSLMLFQIKRRKKG